jgi:methylated-DNA-[protein]-cysteine S-methyltransferase
MVTVSVQNVGNVWFGVAFGGKKIFATSFGPSKKSVFDSLRNSVPKSIQLECSDKESVFSEQVISILKDIYDGEEVRHNFSFEYSKLSNYSRTVIDAVCQIPVGYVASYGGVAQAVGGSPRAVGRVMAMNPFAPLCPCHRVVASDFTLCGYGGGLETKLAFLKREQRGNQENKVISLGKAKLELFPVELVLKKAEKHSKTKSV